MDLAESGGRRTSVVELLTIPEVMRSLRISRAKVYELIRAKELATVKIGRCRRVTPSALADYITGLTEEGDP